MPIATLIAADRLQKGDISAAMDAVAEAGGTDPVQIVIEPEKAVRISFEGIAKDIRSGLKKVEEDYDFVVSPDGERKKLLISDMDSTMIANECIDEMAAWVGKEDLIAPITERAMRGELDFEQSLRERVAALAGMSMAVIPQLLREKIRVSPGAKTLVRTMRSWGARTILVSGGFQVFALPIAAMIGFNDAHANRLGTIDDDGKSGPLLSGEVDGQIVDAAHKRDLLQRYLSALKLDAGEALAIGDGANDIPMIEAAGLGIAYRAKPKTEAAADAALRHNDLSALLYAQGVPRSEWVMD